MKYLASFALFSPVLLVATVAVAQSIPQGTFKHIIIVVQENRTPDNLFGANPAGIGPCSNEDPFEVGVDIVDGGPNELTGGTTSLPFSTPGRQKGCVP